ncbi:hypothetical protein NC653_016043 [Populus alba x Populus x berolinensis]|uniref:Uncharacterized protein n=1 Tax=Populus alba x Populus x berolinensis TaxID=444605 RepID=A0AAD6QLY2_9ROSI|nr:hypothetical protein NC653_016043 [Populus alba x Populus x berolinensis]
MNVSLVLKGWLAEKLLRFQSCVGAFLNLRARGHFRKRPGQEYRKKKNGRLAFGMTSESRGLEKGSSVDEADVADDDDEDAGGHS